MNPLSEFLHKLADLFGHMIGDPVHTQSATAIQTTLKTTGTLLERTGSSAQASLDAMHNKVDELLSSGRAVTPQEWSELQELAKQHSVSPATPAEPPAAPTPASVSMS